MIDTAEKYINENIDNINDLWYDNFDDLMEDYLNWWLDI